MKKNAMCEWCEEYSKPRPWTMLEEERDRLRATNAELLAALKEAADTLIWAAQESTGRVKKEIVGGWIHHSNKARAAIAKAKAEAQS